MNAKDIMTRDIITVSPTMSVKNLAMTAHQESDQRRAGGRQERQDRRRRLRSRHRRQERQETSNPS